MLRIFCFGKPRQPIERPTIERGFFLPADPIDRIILGASQNLVNAGELVGVKFSKAVAPYFADALS